MKSLRLLLTAAAVAAGTLTAAPTVVASTAGAKYEIHHYAWKKMSLAERITAQRRLISSDRIVLATWSSKRWHDQISHDVNGDAYTTGWIRPLDLDAPPPAWVVFRRAHLRWTTRELDESLRQRRIRNVVPEVGDWLTAVGVVQRWFPGTSGWLTSCSSSEGGHGAWVWYAHLSYPLWGPDETPGGWMQYHQTTFWGDYRAAVAYLHRRGVVVPASSASYGSALGQALAGAYADVRGDTGKWTGLLC